MHLFFGMRVLDVDNVETGTLDRILIHPDNRQVIHVIVQSPRASEDVLIPLSMVQGNTDSRLLLHARQGDLENMPRYYEGRTTSPPSGRIDTSTVRQPSDRRQNLEDALAIPAGALEFGPDTEVVTSDNRTGRLAGVMTDQYDHQISEVCASGLRDKEVIIPARWIGDLRSERINANVNADQLDRLVGTPAGTYLTQESGEPRRIEERNREAS